MRKTIVAKASPFRVPRVVSVSAWTSCMRYPGAVGGFRRTYATEVVVRKAPRLADIPF